MKNRHQIVSVLLLTLLMSVIFFVSCGIPDPSSYFSIEDFSISEASDTPLQSLTIDFSGDMVVDKVVRIDDGPGLLLFYYLGSSSNKLDSSTRNTYKTKVNTYLDNFPVPVINNQDFAEQAGLKAFLVGSSDDSYPYRPMYSFNLKNQLFEEYTNWFGIQDLVLTQDTEKTLEKDSESFNGYWYKLSVKDNPSYSTSLRLQTVEQNDLSSYDRLYVFATIAPGVGDFNNPIWSNCFFVGCLSIETTN